MGVTLSPSCRESQELRLKIKTLGQRMKRLAIEGIALSPWEAEVLVDEIHKVYFSDPELSGLSTGQMKYSCTAASEGAGKALDSCSMVTVTLTLLSEEDAQDLPRDGKRACVARRQRRLVRLADQAREQGGLLTQEDLANLLSVDVRTIRRDISDLAGMGVTVPTRGQQKDIGPGVSHRGQAVRLWLEGKEPVDVARALKHSLASIESYLEKFKRVVYLRQKNFDDFEIALTIGMSVPAVKTFVGIYHQFRNCSFFKSRLDEIEAVGRANWHACDEKKDSTSLSASSSAGRMR